MKIEDKLHREASHLAFIIKHFDIIDDEDITKEIEITFNKYFNIIDLIKAYGFFNSLSDKKASDRLLDQFKHLVYDYLKKN